jgi:hypothetical protein
MVVPVARARSTTAVPRMPRFISRRSPFFMTATLRYIAYANGPHHSAPTTMTMTTISAGTGSRCVT